MSGFQNNATKLFCCANSYIPSDNACFLTFGVITLGTRDMFPFFALDSCW